MVFYIFGIPLFKLRVFCFSLLKIVVIRDTVFLNELNIFLEQFFNVWGEVSVLFSKYFLAET